MLALILTSGKFCAAISAIIVLVSLVYRKLVIPFIRQMERIEKVIGTNGGSTLFQRLDEVENAVTMHGSVIDFMDQPMCALSPDGQLQSLNIRFAQVTGWSFEDMQHGGFRDKLDPLSQESFDISVERSSLFDRQVNFRTSDWEWLIGAQLTMKPIFNKQTFLGWRGMLRVTHGN